MNLKRLFKYSSRSAFQKKGIAILAILGIGIGITLMVTIEAYGAGIDQEFDSFSSELVGQFNIQEGETLASFQSQLPANMVQSISESSMSSHIETIAGVQYLPPTVTNYTSYLEPSATGNPGALQINGIEDIEAYDNVSKDIDNLKDGSKYFSNNKYECIISYRLYNANSSIFDLDKTIEVIINQTYSLELTIVGITAEPDTRLQSHMDTISQMQGVFKVYTSIEITRAILNEILRNDTSSHFLHYEHRGLNSSEFTSDSYTLLTLETDFTEGNATDAFSSDLKDYLESQYDGLTLLLTSTGAGMFEQFSEIKSNLEAFLTVISIVTIVAGSMGVIISQLIGVESRLKEFAILKATGWKEKHLLFIVVLESVILGIVGAVTGIFLSKIATIIISRIVEGSSAVMTTGTIVKSILIAIFIGTAGGLYPGIKASSVRPMEILQGK